METAWVRCPLCTQDDARVLFTRGKYQHVRCRHCSFIYVNPQPVQALESNAMLFGQTHPVWSGASATYRQMGPEELEGRLDRFRNRPAKKYRDELRFMKPYLQSGRLLDVGCGDGRFLLAAQGSGWKVTGVEIAEESAFLCRDVFRLDVRPCILEDASFDDGHFDVIRLNQVIEHVPSPLDLLREIQRVLRPGGLLSLATVNIKSFTYSNLGQEWSYLGSPNNEHICFFSRETLDRALSTVDLKSLKWKTKGFRLRNPGTTKGSVAGKGIRMMEKALSPVASWMGRGGRIHVFAERR